MKTEKVELTELIANEGKLIARKEDGAIMGERLYLGIQDKKSNYIEVDKPAENENSESAVSGEEIKE